MSSSRDWVKELNATRHEELVARAKQQLGAIGSPEWEIEIREGAPAVEIARAARERKAALVVIGIGRHTLRDRLFGDETALQLLRISDVPVFAVTPGFTALPRRVIFATDFSEASVRALRGALPLLAGDATVYLTHVVPRFAHLSGIWAAMQQSYVDSLGGRVRARAPPPRRAGDDDASSRSRSRASRRASSSTSPRLRRPISSSAARTARG